MSAQEVLDAAGNVKPSSLWLQLVKAIFFYIQHLPEVETFPSSFWGEIPPTHTHTYQ